MLTVLAVAAVLAAAGPPLGHGADGDRLVNINSASVAELTTLPGIGEAKAKAIVDYREAAPFKTVDDLKLVKGIGEKTLEVLRSKITVGGEASRN
jgi:competence protein ComEA